MYNAVASTATDKRENASCYAFSFFSPSETLAKAIAEQNQRLVSQYVERNFPPGYATNETSPAAEDSSFIGKVASEISGATDALDSAGQVSRVKKLISERLYHYLSSLAETPIASQGGMFVLGKFLPDAMGTMLGLSAYRNMLSASAQAVKIRRLLDELSNEFRIWMLEKQYGVFVTPWLRIELNNQDYLRLTPIENAGESRRSNSDSLSSQLEWALDQFNVGEDTSGATVTTSAEDDEAAQVASS